AGGVTFFTSLTSFNAAAGSHPIGLDFEDLNENTDITSPYGYTLRGVKFDKRTTSSAPLVVVKGANTFTGTGFSNAPNPAANTLSPTSGQNVLSPGGAALVPGPDPGQEDGLQLTFGPPVASVGFDVLFQSLDCCAAVSIQVLGPSGELLLGPVNVPT